MQTSYDSTRFEEVRPRSTRTRLDIRLERGCALITSALLCRPLFGALIYERAIARPLIWIALVFERVIAALLVWRFWFGVEGLQWGLEVH